MSEKMVSWVMEQSDIANHKQLCILYALALKATDDGTVILPDKKWLAQASRCSWPTVRKHLGVLEDQGLLRRGLDLYDGPTFVLNPPED